MYPQEIALKSDCNNFNFHTNIVLSINTSWFGHVTRSKFHWEEQKTISFNYNHHHDVHRFRLQTDLKKTEAGGVEKSGDPQICKLETSETSALFDYKKSDLFKNCMQMKGDLNPTLYLSQARFLTSCCFQKDISRYLYMGMVYVCLLFVCVSFFFDLGKNVMFLNPPQEPRGRRRLAPWRSNPRSSRKFSRRWCADQMFSLPFFWRSHSLRDHEMRHFTSFYLIIVVVSRFFNGRFLKKKWAKQVERIGFLLQMLGESTSLLGCPW